VIGKRYNVDLTIYNGIRTCRWVNTRPHTEGFPTTSDHDGHHQRR
jgi:hypothetical protein